MEISGEIKQEALSSEEKCIENGSLLLGEFLNYLYPDNEMPARLQQRLLKLRSSTKILASQVLQKRQLREGTSTIIRGAYDMESDEVLLAKPATPSVMVHEGIHFLSSKPQSGKTGIRREVTSQTTLREIKADKLINEALTEMITVIVNKKIDISSTGGIVKLQNELDKARKNNQTSNALSYSLPTKRVVDLLTGYFYISRRGETPDTEILKTNLPELVRAYFEADREKFDQLLDNYPGIKRGQKISQTLRETVEAIPKEKGQFLVIYLQELLKHTEFNKSSKKFKKYLEIFVKTLVGKNKDVNMVFSYPEDVLGFVETFPSTRIGSVKTIPEFRMSLDLVQAMRNAKVRNEYLSAYFQFPAFALWQGLKIEALKNNKKIEDKDFFNNDTILDFIASLDTRYEPDICKMAYRLFGVQMTNSQMEKVTQRRSKSK